MNFESAPFFCLPFKFQPAIYSKKASFIHWILSFLPKTLLQMRHLSSSSILYKLKKDGDSIANAAIYLVIFILYISCDIYIIFILWYLYYYIICAVSNFSFIPQPFILPRSIKWVPEISGNLVIKSKLSPRSGSSLEAVEPHPYKKGPSSFFLSTC